MKIGILSDTHDEAARTRRALDLLHAEKVEALIHCGDFTSSDILHLCADVPTYFVFGNNDWNATRELEVAASLIGAQCLGWAGSLELVGRRVAVTHGHLLPEVRKLLDAKPDYLLLGHAHRRQDDRQEGVRVINPGAIHHVRDRNGYSVAVLDLEADDLRFLTLGS